MHTLLSDEQLLSVYNQTFSTFIVLQEEVKKRKLNETIKYDGKTKVAGIFDLETIER